MNIFEKWTPLYAPEVEGVGGGDEGGPPPEQVRPVPINERPVDGPGSGRSQIRKELETAVKDTRERDEKVARSKGKTKPEGTGYQSRAREMQEGAEPPEAGQQVEPVEGQEAQPAAPKEVAPDAYSKEAKAVWAQVPEAFRQAVVKREQDVERGVAALQQRYADLDQVLTPRAEVIKRHGHTPAQAVNQLFSWFDALGQDPDRVRAGQPPIAFIHLAKSFGLDKLIEEAAKGGQQAQGQPGAGGQPAGEIPAPVQQYITQLEGKLGQFSQLLDQRFGGLESALTQTRAEKTNEILAHWAQDKEHFGDVKLMMAHLLESGAVAPLADGRADLDKAYEMAVYAIPEVRTKVLAANDAKRIADEKAKRDAEQKAQQEQANKARRAAGGLAPGAPGIGAGGQPPGKGVKKSVRESLNDAITELSS
jgi:hypothetical protein